jgi:uncharacterized protein involved in response to NO
MKVDKVLKGIVLLITAVMLVIKLCGWADISWLKVFSVAIVYILFYMLGVLYLLWYNSPKVKKIREDAEKEAMHEMLQNAVQSASKKIKERENNENI